KLGDFASHKSTLVGEILGKFFPCARRSLESQLLSIRTAAASKDPSARKCSGVGFVFPKVYPAGTQVGLASGATIVRGAGPRWANTDYIMFARLHLKADRPRAMVLKARTSGELFKHFRVCSIKSRSGEFIDDPAQLNRAG